MNQPSPTAPRRNPFSASPSKQKTTKKRHRRYSAGNTGAHHPPAIVGLAASTPRADHGNSTKETQVSSPCHDQVDIRASNEDNEKMNESQASDGLTRSCFPSTNHRFIRPLLLLNPSKCLSCKKTITKGGSTPQLASGGIISATAGFMNPTANDVLKCSLCDCTVHLGCIKLLTEEQTTCVGAASEQKTSKPKIEKKKTGKSKGNQLLAASSSQAPPLGHLIAFINSRSGEGQGLAVYQRLQRLAAVDRVRKNL